MARKPTWLTHLVGRLNNAKREADSKEPGPANAAEAVRNTLERNRRALRELESDGD